MKLLKKSFLKNYVLITTLSIFALTACDSDDKNGYNDELPPANRVDITVNATINEFQESSINMKWRETDAIVFNGSSLSIALGSGSNKATFIGKVSLDNKDIIIYYPPYLPSATGFALKLSEQKQEGGTENNLKRYLYMIAPFKMTTPFSENDNKVTLDFQYQVSVLDFNVINSTGSDIKIEAVLLEGTENAFYEIILPYYTSSNTKGAKQGLVINNPIVTKNNESFQAHMAICLTSDSALDGQSVKMTVYTDKGQYPFTRIIDKSFVKGKRYPQILKLE